MIPVIIVGLVVALIVFVIIANVMQQQREKVEAEKRMLIAKQKAIIDETEQIILNLTHLPPNPGVLEVLNRRSLNAAKAMQKLQPEIKNIKQHVQEFDTRLQASIELSLNQQAPDETFVLPENEKQLIVILQCVKKIRAILKSEQKKGVLDATAFTQQDQRLDAIQLKINIESLIKRSMQAYDKEMLGSARQYLEKAIQTLTSHPIKSEYIQIKLNEINEKLEEITSTLKSANATDAAKKSKESDDDIDMLFQPKKKW